MAARETSTGKAFANNVHSRMHCLRFELLRAVPAAAAAAAATVWRAAAACRAATLAQRSVQQRCCSDSSVIISAQRVWSAVVMATVVAVALAGGNESLDAILAIEAAVEAYPGAQVGARRCSR